MVKIKVLSYNKYCNHHTCEDIYNKKRLYIDLFVDKQIPNETVDSIVGKIIECDIYAHEYIAMDVKVIGE